MEYVDTEGLLVREVYKGRYLRYLIDGRWEFVERVNTKGVVVICAVTEDDCVLFVEQYRRPVKKRVIELPAGLTNDEPRFRHESLRDAAKRELEEETGYTANELEELMTGPISAGLTSEQVTFFSARGLTKISAGGGDANESIVVHVISLSDVRRWLTAKRTQGLLVDPKVYAGLYLAGLRQN